MQTSSSPHKLHPWWFSAVLFALSPHTKFSLAQTEETERISAAQKQFWKDYFAWYSQRHNHMVLFTWFMPFSCSMTTGCRMQCNIFPMHFPIVCWRSFFYFFFLKIIRKAQIPDLMLGKKLRVKKKACCPWALIPEHIRETATGSHVPQERRGKVNLCQESVFTGIGISLELKAVCSEWNHLLLKGSITLLNEAFYLCKLINFCSGKPEGEKSPRRSCKEEPQRGLGSHTSTSAPQNAHPWGAQDNVLLLLGHSTDGDGRRALNKALKTLLWAHTWLSKLSLFPALSSSPQPLLSAIKGGGITITQSCYTPLQDLSWVK